MLMPSFCVLLFFLERIYYLSDFQKIRFCAAWTINNFKLHDFISPQYMEHIETVWKWGGLHMFAHLVHRSSAYSPNLLHIVLCKHLTELIFLEPGIIPTLKLHRKCQCKFLFLI